MSNACPACGKKYSLPDGSVGRAFVCKRCGLTLEITHRGLEIPRVPDAGPPVPPPQPVLPPPPPAQQPPAYAPPPPAPPLYPTAVPSPPRNDFAVPDDAPAPPRRRGTTDNTLVDYLLLRRYFAPVLIVGVFWVGSLVLVVTGLFTIVASFSAPQNNAKFDAADAPFGGGAVVPKGESRTGFSPVLFLTGAGQILFGPLALRLWCEFLIVVFRIHETLQDVKDGLARRRP